VEDRSRALAWILFFSRVLFKKLYYFLLYRKTEKMTTVAATTTTTTTTTSTSTYTTTTTTDSHHPTTKELVFSTINAKIKCSRPDIIAELVSLSTDPPKRLMVGRTSGVVKLSNSKQLYMDLTDGALKRRWKFNETDCAKLALFSQRVMDGKDSVKHLVRQPPAAVMDSQNNKDDNQDELDELLLLLPRSDWMFLECCDDGRALFVMFGSDYGFYIFDTAHVCVRIFTNQKDASHCDANSDAKRIMKVVITYDNGLGRSFRFVQRECFHALEYKTRLETFAAFIVPSNGIDEDDV
jgi:hypothetical protein